IMDWLEISVEVDQEAVEPVSELFARLGYNGGVVVEQNVEGPQSEQSSWDELQFPEIDPNRPISVRTYLPIDGDADEKRKRIEGDNSEVLNILDLGTGSGILAIAAAKLGGDKVKVVAYDTDPVAVEATQQNVDRNGLNQQIEVGLGSSEATKADGPYDLIVAN